MKRFMKNENHPILKDYLYGLKLPYTYESWLRLHSYIKILGNNKNNQFTIQKFCNIVFLNFKFFYQFITKNKNFVYTFITKNSLLLYILYYFTNYVTLMENNMVDRIKGSSKLPRFKINPYSYFILNKKKPTFMLLKNTI